MTDNECSSFRSHVCHLDPSATKRTGSIAYYLVVEVWCDRMNSVMRQWHEICWNRVGSQVCLSVLSSLVSLLCVCLHWTVSSVYTSVHNLATHVCHLSYNCHLHSQWVRLRHKKVTCHIHVSFASALSETRRSASLFWFYFSLLAESRSSTSGLDRSTQ